MQRARRTYKNLVEKVLDELLLERAGGEQAVKVCAEELGNKVAKGRLGRDREDENADAHILKGRDKDVAEADDLRGREQRARAKSG